MTERLQTRAGRISAIRGALLTVATVGGYMFGSPLPRCVLGILLMLPRCATVRVYEVAPSETSDRGRCARPASLSRGSGTGGS